MHQLLSSILFLCLLVLPLAAQEEALHGTWEGTIVDGEVELTTRLTFYGDGTYDQVIEGSALLAAVGFLDSAAAAGAEIPTFETFSAHLTGTYRVEGDSLWFDVVESNLLVDGKDAVEVLTQVARALARFAADIADVSAEDYPAFEQTAVAEILAGFNEEEFAEGMSGTYAIEGDTLFLIATTEEGGVETLELHRIDGTSAVGQTTWGGLKAAWRP